MSKRLAPVGAGLFVFIVFVITSTRCGGLFSSIKNVESFLQLDGVGLVDVVAVIAVGQDFVEAAELAEVVLAALCVDGE